MSAIDMTLFTAIAATQSTLQAQCIAANAQIAAIPPPIPPAPPSISGYTSTLYNLEYLTNWIQPGDVGDSGGSGPTGTFIMTPGSITAPAVFSAKGTEAYADGYWYTGLGPQTAATKFRLALQFQLPTPADLANCQAVEFELQQGIGNMLFNMAYQADWAGTKLWRIFNYASSAWEATTIPLSLVAGVWTTVVAEFIRTPALMYHLGITINGIWHPLMASHAGVAQIKVPYFNAAFQLDSIGGNPPPAYKCDVQNYDVSWA